MVQRMTRGLPLGQEGQVPVALSPAPFGAAPGQADQKVALAAPANLGQEGPGLAVLGRTHTGVLHGQEGHELLRPVVPSYAKALVAAAGHSGCPIGQEGQRIHPMGGGSHSQGAATAAAKHDGLLFMPGVLEALSGAFAARLAAQETTNGNVAFTFNAGKNLMQASKRGRGAKEKMWEFLREQRIHVR